MCGVKLFRSFSHLHVIDTRKTIGEGRIDMVQATTAVKGEVGLRIIHLEQGRDREGPLIELVICRDETGRTV